MIEVTIFTAIDGKWPEDEIIAFGKLASPESVHFSNSRPGYFAATGQWTRADLSDVLKKNLKAIDYSSNMFDPLLPVCVGLSTEVSFEVVQGLEAP